MTDELLHDLDKRQVSFETFVKAYIESNNQRMAQLDDHMAKMEQRMNERMEDLDRRTNERMDKMDQHIDKVEANLEGINKSFHNVTLAAIVGIGAIVISVFALVGTLVYTVLTRA